MKKALVTGAGGFIGSHLVKRLVDEGYHVTGLDVKPTQFEPTAAHEFRITDLLYTPYYWFGNYDEVYHLAADMGGIGYIGTQRFHIATNNSRMDSMILKVSAHMGVEKFFFSSSACVYPVGIQEGNEIKLKESDAWPADPERGYGLEKLFMEQLCAYAREEFNIQTKVGRFHNVYGPCGTWTGGKEKFPAALCRKVVMAKDGDEIEIWGDGKQIRSFLYINDCIDGIRALMKSDKPGPFNIGTDDAITIDGMASLVAGIAGKNIRLRHNLDGPVGVKSRNSDNTKVQQQLDWKPQVPLAVGIERTYKWIQGQIEKSK